MVLLECRLWQCLGAYISGILLYTVPVAWRLAVSAATSILKKWYRMTMCFVRLWGDGFLASGNGMSQIVLRHLEVTTLPGSIEQVALVWTDREIAG